jgi:hypothetical protein
VAAGLHCSSVWVGLNLLLKSLCWLKPLIHFIVIKSVAEKKKKKKKKERKNRPKKKKKIRKF